MGTSLVAARLGLDIVRVLLIANPNSTGQSDSLFRRVIPVLRAVDGVRLTGMFTHHPGHAEEICRGLGRRDWDVVVVVGGDGTVHEAVNGLLGPVGGQLRDPRELPALAVVPTGSANVFARALGFPPDPVAAVRMLADLLRSDLRRTICLGTWNDRWFAVNAGFGMDADVIARVHDAREHGFAATPLRYLRVSLLVWARARHDPPHIDVHAVSTDGRELRLEDVPLFVASNTNPWTFLGPLPVVTNPRNSFDQGLGLFGLSSLRGARGVASMLHLIGFGHSTFFEDWIRGRTLQFDDAAGVELTCRRPQGFQADGEYVGEFERAVLGSRIDAIEVFAPKQAYPVSPRAWRQVRQDVVRILRALLRNWRHRLGRGLPTAP
ncbi:diacylglycerol kinase family lipid kinase [Corynebacterium hylobatis]|uniref:Diacylglycerol kinase family lipid kinase n=1 Tax=Corynebacterium hylobatis TaxID=1859290 RepID=A0A3S0HFJ9_9CORY|nr:diacylglycerol kinase family protein [Corynebacterium hylobatis]RSZ61566.1 diacylglycerol kinase family lipid kinase [Corynebacterium hylobatis]